MVDYKQLSPEEIQLVVKSLEGGLDSGSFEKIVEKISRVDGRKIIELERLSYPGPEECPVRVKK